VCKLTPLQEKFRKLYPILLNGTEACRQAGYQGDDNVLAVQAHHNLRNPKILAAMEEDLNANLMPLNEALTRLAQQARSPQSIAMSEDGIDLEKVKSLGLMHLVKSIIPTKYGDKVEFYDAQSALAHIVRAHQAITVQPETEQIITVETRVPRVPNPGQ